MTAIGWVTGFLTVAKQVIIADSVGGSMLDSVIDFIACVDGTIEAIVHLRRFARLTVLNGIANFLAITK